MYDNTILATVMALSHPLGRHFFHEGPSPWPVGNHDRPGKSMDEAYREQHNLLNAIRRQDAAFHPLVDKLAPCRTEDLCLSGASPPADLARHRLMVSLIRNSLPLFGPELSLITVISTERCAHLTDLSNRYLFRQIRPRLVQALGAFRFPIIGGLELSINEAANGWHRPRIVEHAHLIVPRPYAEHVRQPLKKAFPATNGISRPVRIEDFDGSDKGIAYTVKNRTMRRIDLGRDADGIRRTRWKPLRCAERLALALAQDLSGLDACTFAHRLRLVIRDGEPRLVRADR